MAIDQTMARESISISAAFERAYPLGIAFIVVMAIFANEQSITGMLMEKKLSMTNAYSAAFAWSAVQTAFVFGVYAFVAGGTGDFITKCKKTHAYDDFL